MGCCKLGRRRDKMEVDGKHFDRNEKRFQISKLKQFLKTIDEELNILKTRDGSIEHKTKRALYLSTMKIILHWGEKMIEVNPDDNNLNELVDKVPELLNDNDEFKLYSWENKIKFFVNNRKNI